MDKLWAECSYILKDIYVRTFKVTHWIVVNPMGQHLIFIKRESAIKEAVKYKRSLCACWWCERYNKWATQSEDYNDLLKYVK